MGKQHKGLPVTAAAISYDYGAYVVQKAIKWKKINTPQAKMVKHGRDGPRANKKRIMPTLVRLSLQNLTKTEGN